MPKRASHDVRSLPGESCLRGEVWKRKSCFDASGRNIISQSLIGLKDIYVELDLLVLYITIFILLI